MAPPPVVTGISPKEGLPGTRVTIRGENLGNRPQDLIGLTICGCDCLLSAEWKSANKIVARSGPGKTRGDIVVSTASGGRGTSTVQFRGYHETIGPLKESAVWVEEAPLQTLAWGRRSLSPTSYQVDDPLGLSVEGNEKKFPEDDLHELFPEGCGDLASDQFEPGWFLLEHHHATSFDDLKSGLSYLRRKVEGQKEGQLSFLKANVGSVMEQLDTLFLLKEKFEADVKSFGVDRTVKMENSIAESMLEANKLFEGVLKRRERADATRNALGVLQRFRFLFTLPVAIERNIKRGEYDAVINDYARALNLFGKTDVVIFKKVLIEVQQKINDLQEMLKLKLQDMPTTLDQQKKIIRNLVNLDAGGDPAWSAIQVHAKYLTEQLNSCYNTHMAADSSVEEGKTPKSSHSKHSRTPSGNQILDSQSSVPQRVLCVEELTEIMSSRFPDLWKLGQAYFSGELQVPAGPNQQQEFKSTVLNVIGLGCNLLRAVVLPHTLETKSSWPPYSLDQLPAWMPHCLRYVRSIYSRLISLDLPGEALDIVGKLLFDLQLSCMSTLLVQAGDQLSTLHTKETWQLHFDSRFGGITSLPTLFEEIITEAITLIKETVLQSGIREVPLLDDENAKKEFSNKFQNTLLSFVQALEKLVSSNDIGDHSPAISSISQLIGSPAHFRDHSHNSGLAWEQRLLCTLSNCSYTEKEVLPKILELLNRHNYPPLPKTLSAMTNALNVLERGIIETYIEHKSDPLVGTIEPSMYLGKFDWDTQQKPTDLRPYAKEIIYNVVGVHAELYRICPDQIYYILSQIVETIAEELSRLMSCVKSTKFSLHGNQQARIDVTALQQTFSAFTTSTAESFFTEALEVIPPLKAAEAKIVDDVLKTFNSNMHLRLACLRTVTKSSKI